MIKIKNNIFITMGLVLLGLVFFFETQLLLINASSCLVLQVIAVILLLVGGTQKGMFRLSASISPFLLMWLTMLPFFAYGLLHSEKMVVIRIIVCIVVVIVLTTQDKWLNSIRNILLIGGAVSIFFTCFFYFFPDLYSYVVDFYGYFPPGTGFLKYGYRAGITANYSQNGIHIAVFIMTFFCNVISFNNTKNRKKYIHIIILGIAFLAFLLNGKRGTLIWCVLSMLLAWFISSEKKSKIVSRLIILGSIALVALEVAINTIPALSFISERFMNIGTDGSATDRIAMWKLAFENFSESPILGIGFLNYRESYDNVLASSFIRDFADITSYRRLDAHNVYFQMLCETGIIGSTLYVLAIGFLLMNTISVIKYFSKKGEQEKKAMATLALCLQIFYLLYSLTGNCLYDMVFYLYAFAMAMVSSLDYKMRKELKYNG